MPLLFRNIEAKIFDNFIGDVKIFSTIEASIQFEDYIKLNAFTAYLQNFTKAETVQFFKKPLIFGLTNQYSLPMTTLEMDYEPNISGLEWYLAVINPCDSNPWVITNNNKSVRYNITDSLNCGGTCNDVQEGTATAFITVGNKKVFMDLDFEGIGELQAVNYELIEIYLDGELIANASSTGGGLLCDAFGPITKNYIIPPPYVLEANSSHTLYINFTTNDEFYHVGCYYQIDLDFITS
jgi:hypothetical protein